MKAKMNRIEKVREYVDNVLRNINDAAEQRDAYIHLYGVAGMCTLIALKRKENVELATIAGMLHDLYSYSMSDRVNHAEKGSVMARDILSSMEAFSEEEISIICGAIHNHSDKSKKQLSFDEVVIDADVLQHCLYNPLFDVSPKERARYNRLKTEFGLD